ncbi:RNA polymerase sigma factor [Paenibacillus senegalimassiliensis]|uniref:RNA polymerase sigma factor n=1 Tax=Paenibacillus senegalimassiliensis TaxID=1737426 RepID=UPI00073F30A4|nr:RNA polymerase sigma factor [Paenibacillus senegalimassiliensis]
MATEREVVEQLVRDYGTRLYTFCRRLAFTSGDADDLYQQTYLRILDMKGTLDLSHNPAGFLMSIATRIWSDERRKFARRQRIAPLNYNHAQVNEVPDKRSTEKMVEQQQTQIELREAVQQLSDALRVPVLLYYMADMSVQDISDVLRIPQGTVKSRLHQGRQKLKLRLEESGYDG